MTEDRRSRESTVPLIVRIAGLPISAIESFRSELCAREIQTCSRLQRDLEEARAEMVDRLHAVVSASPPEARRLLLAVKRDCFNGRSLKKYRDRPSWKILQESAGELADRILRLEERLAALEAGFEAAYSRERDRERHHLAQVLKDKSFLRGVALASRVVAESLERKGSEPVDDSRRKARRLELSLIRYVSRTALKLSPYSTLTRLGLGVVTSDLAEGGVQLQGSGWQERSLLRLKRYVLDQYREMLLRYPPFRDGLTVVLNSTIEEIAPGRYRFLRPSYWEIDEQRGRLQFIADSVVKVNLGGELVLWLLDNLTTTRTTYRELVTTLEGVFADNGGASDVDQHLQGLLRIGFLRLALPWPSNEAHLERRMLEHLQALPEHDDQLQDFIRSLGQIVALECGYPSAEDPVRSVDGIDRLINEAWKAAARLGGANAEIGRGQVMRSNFYEDVFLVPAETWSQDQAILQVPRPKVDELLQNIEPLVRLRAVNNHRHDFLHTIVAFINQRWPGRRQVGLLELFNEIQPLWTDYLKYDAASRRGNGWKSPFNPLRLSCIASLHEVRETIWSELAGCVRVEGEESRVYSDDLWALLDHLPRSYLPPVGACLFLQAADVDGSLWVLNRIYEGVGRFGSRFTPVMAEDMRRRYTEHLAANSVFEWRGRRVELIDILCTQGDTLNVHPPQTFRILEMPGERSELPAGRTLGLRDLHVVVDQETQLPELVDPEGRHLLPAHLGGASHIYMPSLVKFLCLLGPGEGNPAFPAAHYRDYGELRIRDRMTLGNVVLRRKKWVFPPGTLVDQAAAPLSDSQAFHVINRWRQSWGIPDRVFFIEKVRHELLKSRYKPQYIDFTSPLLVAMFRASLRQSADPLVLEEMLPSLQGSPRDDRGERWAVELLLDTVALEPGAGSRQFSPMNLAFVPSPATTVMAEGNRR